MSTEIQNTEKEILIDKVTSKIEKQVAKLHKAGIPFVALLRADLNSKEAKVYHEMSDIGKLDYVNFMKETTGKTLLEN